METEGQNVASSSPSSPSLVSGRSVSRYSCEKTGLGMTMFDRSDASMELWRTSSKRVVCSWPALELPIRVLETSDRVKTTNSSSPPPQMTFFHHLISCLPSSGLFWSLSIISASSAPAPPCVHMVPLSLSSHYTSFRQTLHLTLLSVSLPLFTALSISPPPPWRPPGSVNQTSVKNHVHMFMFSSVFSPSTRHQAPVCEKRFIHTWLCLLSQKDCVLVVGLNPQEKEVWHQSLTGRLCSLCST